MTIRYEPPSDFLREAIRCEQPLATGPEAKQHVRQLIQLMRDGDTANRDWATMLLSQEDIDTPEVREALLRASEDEDDIVRAEALLGLARRDRQLALPLVRKALSGQRASAPLFEAAAIIADPSFVADLRDFAVPSGDDLLDRRASAALAACEGIARPAS
ncbi:HEAT repeat domain-containing protein [Sphingomonas sp.]|uniref:HEAT repeat domain-containing protein n=1 Tax=Sphingomonas sp. TaxID=28214 RepID=UPI0017D51BDD|nr:HEAT repeat domain-containing protein [Sphingomonas sp.]MBA3512326.1 HEAT repeat domain-containing protein [Sphingomonas sp.]